jgi:3-oxoacyl-[acyl-carrier-protein] synthase-3
MNPEGLRPVRITGANLRIIEAARRRLGLPESKVFVNIEKYGNLSGATCPVALSKAVDQGLVREGW